LTDGKGKTIECKNAIFIMTSNLASDEIAKHGLKLREESERLLIKRLDEKSNEDQEPENIEISRNFKDQVVSIYILLKIQQKIFVLNYKNHFQLI
jgi:ATP-dependent Clp protease ATP-binding subunit ClpB